MYTTDFCFPLPDYEHPRLVSYRHLFEARASPLIDELALAVRRPVDLAFHDARFASADSVWVCARRISSVHPRTSRTSDTPVASPSSTACFLVSHERSERGLPRPLPSPRREDETSFAIRGAVPR